MKRLLLLLLPLLLAAPEAHALFTEVGLNYGRKRTSFDANNWIDQESSTVSISFYFLEKLALEMSYTKALAIRDEKTPSSSTTVIQTTNVYGSDLIWVFAGRKEFFQPYIKGGAARVERSQEVKDKSSGDVWSIKPDVAIVPSYGIGFKIAVTEAFGIKVGYDGWKTPLGGGDFSNDDSLRVGVTWFF